MHRLILLGLWAVGSFLLYKIASTVLASCRHARAAHKIGCQLPHRIQCRDPIGIGIISQLLKADNEGRFPQYLKHRVDTDCAREGKVLTTFYQNILGSTSFFTVDPDNVKALLATQFKHFGLGDVRNQNLYPLIGWGIFTTDGKAWEHSRALLRPQFARDQISDLEHEETHIKNMMRVIPAGKGGWTDVFDIVPLLFCLTLDSITEFLFGESVDIQLAALPGYTSERSPMPISAKEFAFSLDKAQATIAKATRLGDMYWLAHDKALKEHCSRCHTFIDHYVQRALKKQKGSIEKTSYGKGKYYFLEAIIETTRDPIQLRSQLISVLLAGRDTTASLMAYVFMVLTQHPNVYAKLRNIIIEEFGTYNKLRDITFSNLKGCNYLQWVLNETLRLYPVVPLDSRRALQDTTLPRGGGPDGLSPIYIRKDQQVDYSYYIIHRRKDLWGDDADEFKPERWKGRKSGWEYLPFNGGPRICIGQQFALTQAGYMLVRMLQKFEAVEGVGNSWEGKEKGGQGYVRHGCTLTICPADGVKLRMREAKE